MKHYQIPTLKSVRTNLFVLKSVPTKFIGQGGVVENNKFKDQVSSPHIGEKIRKLRQGCDSFWMHYEHEVKSCTICTDDFIENWEIVMDIKVENAVLKLVSKKNQNSTHSVACGNLKEKSHHYRAENRC